MKKEIRLYNVIFPVWLMFLFPVWWAIALPGNLAIDCGVLLITLAALKHERKFTVMKYLWWRFWLLGFAADFVGTALLALAFVPYLSPRLRFTWWEEQVSYLFHNPFGSPLAFFWTLAAFVLAGACIYFFDRRAMRRCELLTGRQRHIIALVMAAATAPWTFFIVMY